VCGEGKSPVIASSASRSVITRPSVRFTPSLNTLFFTAPFVRNSSSGQSPLTLRLKASSHFIYLGIWLLSLNLVLCAVFSCPKKQSDSDLTPAWLLKECSALVPTITNIVNLSIALVISTTLLKHLSYLLCLKTYLGQEQTL